MAISFFIGLMGGSAVGYATQGKTTFCQYVRQNHPTLLKSLGVILTLLIILVPTAILTGILVMDATPFFWGGCMAMSFVYGFIMVHCSRQESEQQS